LLHLLPQAVLIPVERGLPRLLANSPPTIRIHYGNLLNGSRGAQKLLESIGPELPQRAVIVEQPRASVVRSGNSARRRRLRRKEGPISTGVFEDFAGFCNSPAGRRMVQRA